MTAQTIVLPYLRSSPICIPRRDIALAGTDNLALQIVVVESDDPSASPVVIGAPDGPTLNVKFWVGPWQRSWWTWDYGLPPFCVPSLLCSIDGIPTVGFDGTWDVAVPIGTFQDYPAHIKWGVFMNFGTGTGSEMLASGSVTIMAIPTV